MSNPSSALGAPAATPYNISIKMSDKTLEGLDLSKASLYLFKASASSMGGGAPTVWSSTQAFSNDTEINWTESYAAYAAVGEVRNGVTFNGSSAKNLDLGESLLVAESAITKVSKVGTPGWITVTNTTTTPFACGLAQPGPADGKVAPICAFPLYGLHSDLIQPIEKVALVFATEAYKQGTVIEGSIGPAVLVDLTGQQSAALTYDINGGWSWAPTEPVSDIASGEFVSALVTEPSVPTLPGGASTPPEPGVTELVLNPTVFRMSQGEHWLPITEIARGLRGHSDGRTLAFKLAAGGGVAKGTEYIVTFIPPGNFGLPKAYRAKCTYVPMYADNPFDFQLLEDVTVYIFG